MASGSRGSSAFQLTTKLGPFKLPLQGMTKDGGTLVAADKDSIWIDTKCNCNVRGRPKGNKKQEKKT